MTAFIAAVLVLALFAALVITATTRIEHPRDDYGPVTLWGQVDAEPPWLFSDECFRDEFAAVDQLRAELECDAAVVLWLAGGAA